MLTPRTANVVEIALADKEAAAELIAAIEALQAKVAALEARP